MSAIDTTLHPFIKKEYNNRSKYGLQHGALSHTDQQAIKGTQKTRLSIKPFKQKNQPFHIYLKNRIEIHS